MASAAASPAAAAGPRGWSDDRVERTLGAVACLVLLAIAAMVVFVLAKAWPSFADNGLSWFTNHGDDFDQQLGRLIETPGNAKTGYHYTIGAWPILYATFLTTAGAVLVGLIFSVLAAIFIVEFAPDRLRAALEPIVRLLAGVPSVVYGLIGVLVISDFVGNHIITQADKDSVNGIIQLDGNSLFVATLILTVMIAPLMVAIIVDALRRVPRMWTEGASALGVNRWRVIWTISVRTARPAIVAAAVLAAARALGEAIMLAMVSGSRGFAPNPLDGLTFFLEPIRPLAATIIDFRESQTIPPVQNTLFAFAAVLMVSTAFLSLGGWWSKQSLRRYGLRV